MNRKSPRVVSIQGSYRQDIITQADLASCAQLQEAEWLASRMAQKAVFNIEVRLLHGATIEPGSLTFDSQLRMSRSRRKKTEAWRR